MFGYRNIEFSEPESQVVLMEQQWRKPPVAKVGLDAPRSFTVARGICSQAAQYELAADPVNDVHTVSMSLRTTNVTFWKERKQLCKGHLPEGSLTVVGPGQACRAVYSGPYDAVRLFLSERFLAECHEEAYGRSPDGPILLGDLSLFRDSRLTSLIRALAVADEVGLQLGQVYAEGLSVSIAACLLARRFGVDRRVDGARHGRLADWRLNRTLEFIHGNLGEPITLIDMANAAGLTRMYFASQFRAATGSSPHEYLMRERVARAQELLAEPTRRISEVALAVGFLSQAHFTTVFKRFVGDTPHKWRECARR